MTLKDVLHQMEQMGNEKMRAQNTKNGCGNNQFGVRLGEIRKLAKSLKKAKALAKPLWDTGNIDARLLGILLTDPKSLSVGELDPMVRSIQFVQVADWFNAYIVKKHPDREILRRKWMIDSDPMAARAGWSLTAERVVEDPDGLDQEKLLDRIEAEMQNSEPMVQWTMNITLAQIGIACTDLRERAISIGHSLGVYRDYPTSKGCTSPFAPIWIKAMVERQT